MEVEELWVRWLEEPLEASEEEALLEAMSADSELRARLLLDLEFDGWLRALGSSAADGDVFARQVQDRLRAEREGEDFVARVAAQIQKERSREEPEREGVETRPEARDQGRKRSAPRRSSLASGRARRRPASFAPVLAAAAGLLVVALLWINGREPSPGVAGRTPTPKPTRSPTLVSTPSPAPSARPSRVPTRSPSIAPSPEPSSVPRPTPEPSPAPLPTPEPSRTAPQPSPTPTPSTQPSPPPTPTPTTRIAPALEIAGARGLELREGRRWVELPKDWRWEVGATVRAKRAGGQVALIEKAALVSLAKGARLTLRESDPPRLRLEAGAVYCAVKPAPNPGGETRFAVETRDAEVLVTGTEFGVERKGSGTRVAVAAGRVRCRNDAGEVAVEAGQETRVRAGRAPKKPKASDADALFAWRRRRAPREIPIFRFDFERGTTPAAWVQGKVTRGPRRGRNRFVLQATELTPGKAKEGTAVNLAIPVALQVRNRPRLLRFRYYTEQPGEIGVQIKDETWGDNCKYPFFPPVTGAWERVELPCERFFAWPQGKPDPSRPIRPGDQLRYVQIRFMGGLGDSYVDEVELVEVER